MNKNNDKPDIETEIHRKRDEFWYKNNRPPRFLILSRENRIRLLHKLRGFSLHATNDSVEKYADMQICVHQDFKDASFVEVAD